MAESHSNREPNAEDAPSDMEDDAESFDEAEVAGTLASMEARLEEVQNTLNEAFEARLQQVQHTFHGYDDALEKAQREEEERDEAWHKKEATWQNQRKKDREEKEKRTVEQQQANGNGTGGPTTSECDAGSIDQELQDGIGIGERCSVSAASKQIENDLFDEKVSKFSAKLDGLLSSMNARSDAHDALDQQIEQLDSLLGRLESGDAACRPSIEEVQKVIAQVPLANEDAVV